MTSANITLRKKQRRIAPALLSEETKSRFLLNYLNALVISAVLANLVRSGKLAAV
jgi:hypothetical protein